MIAKCTYCGGTEFLRGPEGGMATNILCANPKCRHWFNYAPPFELEDLNRVEPTPEERAVELAKSNAAALAYRLTIIEEGRYLARHGEPPEKCVTDTRNNEYGVYAASGSDLLRLAGWIEESMQNVKRVHRFD
jgi:hypothetical protein